MHRKRKRGSGRGVSDRKRLEGEEPARRKSAAAGCRRQQREAAVLNTGCILLGLHKRVLLDNPFQILKRKKRKKNFQNTTYIYIYSHLNNLTLSNKVMHFKFKLQSSKLN